MLMVLGNASILYFYPLKMLGNEKLSLITETELKAFRPVPNLKEIRRGAL